MYGLPLGTLGSYLIFKATENTPSMSNVINGYTLPYSSILISIIFTFIIIIIIMKVSLSKINKQNNLVEIIELPKHKHFIAVQFHPEFKSRPTKPHPLFLNFIKASIK